MPISSNDAYHSIDASPRRGDGAIFPKNSNGHYIRDYSTVRLTTACKRHPWARILRFYEIATQTGSLLALACLDLSGIVPLVSRCERRELISLFFIQLRKGPNTSSDCRREEARRTIQDRPYRKTYVSRNQIAETIAS
jgi:hypothetical protein